MALRDCCRNCKSRPGVCRYETIHGRFRREFREGVTMRVKFWGTRGSIATPGPDTVHFGGNTSCVEVTTNNGSRFVLDCGTGARPLGANWLATAPKPIRGSLLIGHTHWDH